MARRQTDDETVVVLSGDSNYQQENLNSHDASLADIMDQMRAGGETVQIHIYREGTGERKPPFIRKIPVDKYDLADLSEFLREHYGAGDYRLHFRREGVPGIIQNHLLSIGAELKPLVPIASGTGDTATMMNAMQAMMQQNQQAMMTMLERLKPADIDPRANLDKDLDMVVKLKTAFGGESQKSSGLADILKEGIALLGLLKTAGINIDLSNIGKFFGAAQAADTDNIFGVATQLGPQILEAVKAEQEMRKQELDLQAKRITSRPPMNVPRGTMATAGQMHVLPVPQTATISAPNVPRGTNPAPQSNIPAMVWTALNEQAQADADPDTVAQFVLNQPDASKYVSEILAQKSPYKYIVYLNRPALEYPEWWLDLIEAFRDLTTASKPDAMTETLPDPDSPDAPSSVISL